MKLLHRRQFLRLTGGAAALPTTSWTAMAQAYPARPVRIIVGFAAGASPDIIARILAQWLSDKLGQQFIVDNRPGAGGNSAAEAVARAPSDGYTLLWASSGNTTGATLYDRIKFDFIRDIAPIAAIIRFPNVIVVNPSFPPKTVSELITYAKANRDKISMASAGSGTSTHLSAELFKMMTGTDMVHVPYRGGVGVYTDLMGGQVQVYFPPTASSLAYIKSGQLRALAVTTSARWEGLPEIPAVSEIIPDYEASTWHGLGAPKNTPGEIVERLSREINAALVDFNVRMRLATLGGTPLSGSPTDFGRLIAEETDKWAKVIKFAGIKAE